MTVYKISKKTNIYIEKFGDVSELRILKETEKAFFMAYNTLSFGNETNQANGFWVPKSTWEKESNFYKSKSKNFTCFSIPFFIKPYRI